MPSATCANSAVADGDGEGEGAVVVVAQLGVDLELVAGPGPELEIGIVLGHAVAAGDTEVPRTAPEITGEACYAGLALSDPALIDFLGPVDEHYRDVIPNLVQ